MKAILFVSIIVLAIGNCGGPLITRLYFVNGGKITWLITWLETGGFPTALVLLLVSYIYRRKTEGPNTKLILMGVRILVAASLVGLLFGIANFLYASGVKLLPASTSILISSTQLAFVAVFASIIVKQKFTVFSIAAVVSLIAGAASLALADHSSDSSSRETTKLYAVGFAMMVGFAALIGLCYPLVELLYRKAEREISYTLVMEIQTVVAISATLVATIGMLARRGFQAIPQDAAKFELGEAMYCVVLVSAAMIFLCSGLGSFGIVYSSSSLVYGITNAILLPISEILAVIIFEEKFGLGKGLSLALCLLGFALYYYGEMKQSKEVNTTNEDASRRLLHE